MGYSVLHFNLHQRNEIQTNDDSPLCFRLQYISLLQFFCTPIPFHQPLMVHFVMVAMVKRYSLMRHLCWANTTRPSSHVCHSYSKRNKTPRHSIHNRTIPYRPRNRCVELLLPLTHLYLVSLSRSEHKFRHDTHAKAVCSGSHYHRDNPLQPVNTRIPDSCWKYVW